MRKLLLSVLILTVTTLFAKAQFSNYGHRWNTGRFYDKGGNESDGFISEYNWRPNAFEPNDPYFLFIKNKDAEPVKIYAKFISSFVVARDSFVVSESNVMNETPYLQVALDNPIKLYIARLPRQTPEFGIGSFTGALSIAAEGSFSYTKNKYYYGKDPDVITEMKRKDFIEVMSRIMANKPDVVAKIKDKTYRYGDLKDLISFYLTGKQPVHDYVNGKTE